jgi:hypothetical protein
VVVEVVVLLPAEEALLLVVPLQAVVILLVVAPLQLVVILLAVVILLVGEVQQPLITSLKSQ